MAQLSHNEVLEKMMSGNLAVPMAVRALVDRGPGRMLAKEGLLIDFKRELNLGSPASVQEVARDVLGFSNSEGGLLLFGVQDDGAILGHDLIDSRAFREAIGKFTGTRLSCSVGSCDVSARGRALILPFVLVQRTAAARPNLLHKDIEISPQVAQKVKYRTGSLFYRERDQTKVEPPGDGLYERALLLNFTYATPRARSGLLLADDRPGLRIYDHINDRFFGREEEVSELLAKLESVRIGGVSIAGMGGIGKTELAIELVLRLHKQRRFKRIYSASAKSTMMTPRGAQAADPMFEDHPSFVSDLARWLGLDHPVELNDEEAKAVEAACLRELRGRESVLMFVDNLETVRDQRLFDLLDNRLPDAVSLIVTNKTHKLGGALIRKTLEALAVRESARLLRHELQRQGLDELADIHITKLESKCEELYRHPLAIRWFAWACSRDRSLWYGDSSSLFLDQTIEVFCIDHTLRNLPISAQKILAAVAALQGQIDVEADLLLQTTGLSAEILDRDTWDLRCAGLLQSATDYVDGKSFYSVVPLAVRAAREIGKKHRWEGAFAKACISYAQLHTGGVGNDPLLTDLLERQPREVRYMKPDERHELVRRIQRAREKKIDLQTDVALLQLEAECERHLDNILTARDLYSEAADKILKSKMSLENIRNQEVLLEAATVVKKSGTSTNNLKRSANYLEAIVSFSEQTLRVFATLAELHAALGDEAKYETYRTKARTELDREATQLSFRTRDAAEAALSRAEEIMDGKHASG